MSTAALFNTETLFETSGEYGTSPWIPKDNTAAWQAIWDRNPSGEIAWTKESIESGELGVRLNTGHY
jgi:hypothetical protein